MQATMIPTTYSTMSQERIIKEEDTKIQTYLQSLNWETTKLSNAKLESMLAAGCIRYLAGLTNIDFVVELSKAIHQRYKTTMKLSLWYSTEILNHLPKTDDVQTINELVNDAQEFITKRRYPTE
ncbi:MAG TPA: hypothetical protein VLG12_05980 [Candidatus Saccharimonadales bacterium]|nr:hypothetical protein [Candidatus Saccharimonadales bacterium]